MFINIKSEYNFLNSYVKIDDLINFAKNNQIPAIGICDCATTFGNYKFYKKCQENNIKPLIGLEVLVEGQTLLLYAKNYEGYKRINEINTQGLLKEKIEFKNEKDLICVLEKGKLVTGLFNKTSASTEKLNYYLEVFDSDVYFGYITKVNSADNYQILKNIEEYKLKSICIDKITYLQENELDTYMTLLAIDQGKSYLEIKKEKFKHQNKNLNKNLLLDDEHKKNFEEFSNKCNIKIPDEEIKIPRIKDENGELIAEDYLEKLALAGLKKRNCYYENYLTQLQYELNVINKMGFNNYFLIVWDIIKYAKSHGIYVGPGRGSAAGSLVSYCLGITQIDPIKYGLIFERFLNPGRITMPDIDIDVEDVRRNEIINYLVEKYGSDYICKIGTIQTFLAKSAFRDVAKAWGIDNNLIDYVSKNLDSKLSLEENFKNNKKLKTEILKNDNLFQISKIFKNIEGLPRQKSIHAAGIIISEDKLTNFISYDQNNISLAEASDLENMGLLKIDLLALSNLNFIHKIVENINLEVDPNFNINKINLENNKTFTILSEAKTLGVFQMESEGMRDTLLKIKPDRLEEVANVLALYRPGPKEFILQYSQIKNYQPKNEIEQILADTRGIITFQEQIILIVQKMAGYSLAEADIIRKIISKKDEEALKKIADDFIKRAIEKGYDQSYVLKTFALIAKFAHYGFNKAHAYSYALISYQMAYLKANYKEYFYSELFFHNFQGANKTRFLAEVHRQGIEILAPDILYSGQKVSVENNKIRMGLLNISKIGNETTSEIIKHRQNLTDTSSLLALIFEVLSKINLTKSQIHALVHSGSFDSFGYNRKTIESNINRLLKKDIDKIQMIAPKEIEIIDEEDYTYEEKSQQERNVLSINIKYCMFGQVLKEKEMELNQKIYLLDNMLHDIVTNEIGVKKVVLLKILTIKEITTKKNEKMGFLTVNSKTEHEVVVFSNMYKLYKKTLYDNQMKYVVALVVIKNKKIYLEKI